MRLLKSSKRTVRFDGIVFENREIKKAKTEKQHFNFGFLNKNINTKN